VKRLMLLTALAAAILTACGQQQPPANSTPGIRCVSHTNSEIYPARYLVCWCEVEEGGEWVECTTPEALP